MRLIPVLDLREGQAVHAVKGERERYQPVQSVLCESSDPVSIARAFRDRLGLSEIYIADLDAIEGRARPQHRELVRLLAQEEGLRIILDAGVADVSGAQGLLDLGVSKVVVGAETLPDWDNLQLLPASLPAGRLIFSLDMRAGSVLSHCSELANLSPVQALAHLWAAGWKEVILLDLNRVGSRAGVDRTLIAAARAAAPDISLFAGGGVVGIEELKELDDLGVAGALAATALHRGIITAQHIVALGLNS